MNTFTVPTQVLSEVPEVRARSHGWHCLSLRECLSVIAEDETAPAGSPMELPCTGLPSDEQERAFFMSMELSPDGPHGYLGHQPRLSQRAAVRLGAAFELAARYAQFRESRLSPRPLTGSDTEPCSLMESALKKVPALYRSLPKEWLGFVPIHGNGQVGSFCLVERGVKTHVNVDPAELFARILILRPAAIVLFHNHPSGNLTPSRSDRDLTTKVRSLGAQFGVTLLGHWILSPRDEKIVL